MLVWTHNVHRLARALLTSPEPPPPACLECSMISFASKPSKSCEHNSQALVSKSNVRGRPRLGVTYCTLLPLLTKEGGHLIHLIVPVWGTFLNFSSRCCNAGKRRRSISSRTDPSKMGSKTLSFIVSHFGQLIIPNTDTVFLTCIISFELSLYYRDRYKETKQGTRKWN